MRLSSLKAIALATTASITIALAAPANAAPAPIPAPIPAPAAPQPAPGPTVTMPFPGGALVFGSSANTFVPSILTSALATLALLALLNAGLLPSDSVGPSLQSSGKKDGDVGTKLSSSGAKKGGNSQSFNVKFNITSNRDGVTVATGDEAATTTQPTAQPSAGGQDATKPAEAAAAK